MEALLEILGKIGFEWRQGLFNLVNFLLIFWILKRFAFKPLLNAINERQAAARETQDNFEAAKTELGMAKQKAQTLVDEAKVEANKVIEKSYEQAALVATDMKEKAKKEIEALVDQAKRNIEIDKKEMKEALRKDTVELVMLATEKIIRERLDDTKDRQYIKELIGSLKS